MRTNQLRFLPIVFLVVREIGNLTSRPRLAGSFAWRRGKVGMGASIINGNVHCRQEILCSSSN